MHVSTRVWGRDVRCGPHGGCGHVSGIGLVLGFVHCVRGVEALVVLWCREVGR